MTGLVVVYCLTKYRQPSQTFIELELQELRRRGDDVVVLAVERGDERGPPDSKPIYLDELGRSRAGTAAAHAALAVRSPIRYLHFLAVVLVLRREMGGRVEQLPWWVLPAVAGRLRDRGVDVLHAHFGWSGAAAAACLSALLGRPWSMTVHARDLFVKRRNLWRKVLLADLVVTVCEYNARWIAERRRPRRLLVVPCGVELPARPDAARSTGADPVDVVAVGRMVPKKGFDVLLEALAIVAGRRPGVRAVIVGDGPLRAELHQHADRLGLQETVSFVGQLDHDQTLDLIGRARVLVFSGRVAADGDRDATPTVVVEALARGVPAVVTDVGGVAEIVDATCGSVVPAEDAEALGGALERWLSETAPARAAAAAHARARAERDYDVRVQVGRLVDAWTAISRAGRPRRRGTALSPEAAR